MFFLHRYIFVLICLGIFTTNSKNIICTMYIVHYITCNATKVHFMIILIINQVSSMKLIKLVFSRRLMRDDGKCILCFVLHGY